MFISCKWYCAVLKMQKNLWIAESKTRGSLTLQILRCSIVIGCMEPLLLSTSSCLVHQKSKFPKISKAIPIQNPRSNLRSIMEKLLYQSLSVVLKMSAEHLKISSESVSEHRRT